MKSCLVTLKIGLSSLRVLKIAGIISFELNSASSNTRSPTMRCGLWRFWCCALRGNINMNNLIMHCLLCFFNNSPMITPVKIMSHYKVRHQDHFSVFCRLLTSTFSEFKRLQKMVLPHKSQTCRKFFQRIFVVKCDSLNAPCKVRSTIHQEEQYGCHQLGDCVTVSQVQIFLYKNTMDHKRSFAELICSKT